MAIYTQLSPTATPEKRYSFDAKTAAAVAALVKLKILPAPRETKIPAIASPKLHLVKSAQAMKEIHEIREGLRGHPLDRFITVRDMLYDDDMLQRLDVRYYAEGTSPSFAILYLTGIKSGATQAAAGAGVGEIWATSGHASLPDNVIMIGI